MSARVVTLTEGELGALVGSTTANSNYPFAIAVSLNALGAAADDIETVARILGDKRLRATVEAIGQRLDAVQRIVAKLAQSEVGGGQ